MKKILLVISFFTLLLSGCIPSLHSIATEENRIIEDLIIGDWIDAEFLKDNFKIDPTNLSELDKLNIKDKLNSLPEAAEHQLKFDRAAKIEFEKDPLPSRTDHWDYHIASGIPEMGPKGAKVKSSKLVPAYILTFRNNELPIQNKYMNIELTRINGDIYLDCSPHLTFTDFFSSNYIAGHTFAKVTFEQGQLQLRWFSYLHLEKIIKKKRVRLQHEIVDDSIILTASTEELIAFIEKYGKEEELYEAPMNLIAL